MMGRPAGKVVRRFVSAGLSVGENAVDVRSHSGNSLGLPAWLDSGYPRLGGVKATSVLLGLTRLPETHLQTKQRSLGGVRKGRNEIRESRAPMVRLFRNPRSYAFSFPARFQETNSPIVDPVLEAGCL